MKPSVISVCSPTKYHYDHISYIIKLYNRDKSKELFVSRVKKLYEIAKNLLNKKSNRIFVNLPMISLAKQMKYKNNLVKVYKLNFNYFTNPFTF